MIIYTDASRLNSNTKYFSAWAFVVTRRGKVSSQKSGLIPEHLSFCNTVSEFIAIEKAIEFYNNKVIEKTQLTIKTDSLTFVQYFKRENIENKNMAKVVNNIKRIISENNLIVNFEFIPSHNGHKTLDGKMNNTVDKLARSKARIQLNIFLEKSNL